MADATTFIRKVRRDLEGLEAEVETNPFVVAVASGTARIEALQSFAGHQSRIVDTVTRASETMVSRFDDTAAGDHFRGVLEGERAAATELPALARALGMSERDLRRFEPEPSGFTYGAFYAWLADQGAAGQAVLATAVNFPAWGRACGRISLGLRLHYGLDREATRILDRFASGTPDDEKVTEIVQEALDQGVPAEAMERAARLIQSYQRDFWDTLARTLDAPAEADPSRSSASARRAA